MTSERKDFKTAAENMCSLAKFITEHCGDDPDRLALQKGKWPEVDVAAVVSTLVSRRKLAGKAPLWSSTEGLVLPRTLSAEQCSGEAAARHKAAVALRIMTELQHSECSGAEPGDAQSECAVKSADGGGTRPRIADLTGGLGVDSLEFAKVAEAVLYNEMLPELAAAAGHNFKVLGARNIEVCSIEADAETLGGGNGRREVLRFGRDARQENDAADISRGNCPDENSAGSLRRRLEKFRPNLIFLDPARRDGCGKKVFLLEDCSPDILKIKDMLLEIAPVLMLKLSPMADISMVLGRLGGECRELHIIESGGECKELLVIMRRDVKADDCLIRVYNLDRMNGGREHDGDGLTGGDEETDSPVFEFRQGDERAADKNAGGGQPSERTSFAESEEIVPGALLFEPGKALMKAGCFRLVGKRLGAPALGRDTHYYVLRDNTPDAAGGTSTNAGKLFRILDIAELSGRGIRDFAKRHPEAEVTARNVRMTSEELRKRLGCKPSDRNHIFALRADRPGKNLLLFTERI